MKEMNTATSIIQQEAGEDAEVILGTVIDEGFEGDLRVTVIATGFDLADSRDEARVAPNSTETKKKMLSDDLKIPKAGDITGHSRYSHGDQPYYKGEKNLKEMDKPAIHRRKLKNIRSLNKEEGQKNKEQNPKELLNNRRERIDKSDSDQPAFLRKIMD
jgi:cell division protein FtsZ